MLSLLLLVPLVLADSTCDSVVTKVTHCGHRSHKLTSVGREEGVCLSDQPSLHSYLIP